MSAVNAVVLRQSRLDFSRSPGKIRLDGVAHQGYKRRSLFKNMIHPAAVIDPKAEIHPSVVIGPYAVIDGTVRIGEDCRIGPHVYITGHTTIGVRNKFYP